MHNKQTLIFYAYETTMFVRLKPIHNSFFDWRIISYKVSLRSDMS